MQIRTIDELNTLSTPPEEYFGVMDLTDVQIDERIRLTRDANEAILYAMTLISLMSERGEIDYEFVRSRLENELLGVLGAYVAIDDYIKGYVSEYTRTFAENTRKNITKDWYMSEDRALFNAENTANDALNYGDFQDAIAAGYTRKKWVTERDNKVRDTHRQVEGEIIGIDEYFLVGGSLMRFPKDYELAWDAPEETVNCRCTMKYLP